MAQSWEGEFTTGGAGVVGDIVIPDIMDADGAAFEPDVCVFMFSNPGFADDNPQQYRFQHIGFDDGVTAVGQCTGSNWADGVIWSTYGYNNVASILTNVSRFTPNYRVVGKITAKASGSVTVTITTNIEGGARFKVLALKGVGHHIVNLNLLSGTHDYTGLPIAPSGAWLVNGAGLPGLSDTTTSMPASGFVGTDLTQVSTSAVPDPFSDPAEAYRYQRTNQAMVGVTPAGAGLAVDMLTINGWLPDGFNYTVATGAGLRLIGLLFSGVDVVVGSFTQPVADGEQTVPAPGIIPVALAVMSNGHAAGTTLAVHAQWSMGLSDGRNQGAMWSAVQNGGLITGNGGQSWGGEDAALMMADPDGLDSSDAIVAGKMSIVALESDQWRAAWTQCDGTQRQGLFLAIGGGVISQGTEYAIRRMRQFPLPFDRSFWINIARFELLMQNGMGLQNGQGSNPVLEISFSGDGGVTFYDPIRVEAGRIGEYMRQVVISQVGSMRNAYCRIVDSDPVVSNLLDVFVNVVPQGTSSR